MAKQYALINSEEGDWYIAAYRDGNAIVALSSVERDMGDGDYFPKKKDFKKRDKCTTRTKK